MADEMREPVWQRGYENKAYDRPTIVIDMAGVAWFVDPANGTFREAIMLYPRKDADEVLVGGKLFREVKD